MPLTRDQRLGRYQIRSLLGTGGMGEVYLADDTQLHRNVAIKVLPAEFVDSKDRLERFEREAFAASSLNHPNILTIHEIGESDGCYFTATEHIDGESLRDRIVSGKLPLHELLEIGVQTASALAAAHAAGIVHRDIKPENIMVRHDGIVKVLDFGLAKLTEKNGPNQPASSELPTRHNTAPGVVMGTAAYMSPEQARGKGIDARTDIWSLGVVLYEMVSEQIPFHGETPADIIGLILHKEPVQLTAYDDQVPAELNRIVQKALAKDKEDRYQVVKDLGIDLKSLKRSLEFESALERTGAPNHSTRERLANTAAISAQFSNSQVHTTSSAEYIATGIQRHKLVFAAAAVLLLAAISGLGYFYLGGASGPSINSVAVMPFVNAGGDPNFEYVSDGVSEAIINNLSQLQQLKVISRASTWRYKGKEIDVAEVARALGVGAVVMGRIVQRGDDLQISVEMVNAADGTQIFGEQFTRKAADLQGLQSQISRDIAEKLRLRLTGKQEQQLAKMPTQNPQAYQLYLTGLFYSRKGNTEDIKKALDYFTQAVALDPQFALAYASMPAQFTNLSTSGGDPKELMAKARAAAEKAVELDDTLAEAHSALALIKRNEWDWTGSESGLKRAMELNPNFAGAHGTYAFHLSLMGRPVEALAAIKRSQELDPLRIAAKSNEGLILYFGRRYDEAIQVFQNAIKIQPDFSFSYSGLGYTYSAKGMYAEAIASHQKEFEIDGETTSTLCFLGFAHAMSGKRTEALSILEKLKTTKEHVSPAELAVLYVGLGDKEAAMAALERSYQDRDLQLQYLKVDPHYDPLRSDPRFQDLIRRVGLP